MCKPGDLVPDSHFDVMLIELINDPRLSVYTKRIRSGSEQVFHTDNDYRDFERYRAEGGTQGHNVKMHDKPDTLRIPPPEKHWFAKLVDGHWWWVSGCAECCGHERNWMTYIECEKHDRCRTCGVHRSELKEAPWGGKHGWQCKTCADAEHEAEKQAALAAMPEEYDEWDYHSLDNPTCPYCNAELEEHSLYEADDEEAECWRCDNTFKVTAEVSVSYSMSRKEEV